MNIQDDKVSRIKQLGFLIGKWQTEGGKYN